MVLKKIFNFINIFKLKKKFINNIILKGNKILNEKFFKYLVKQIIESNVKSSFKLFQLITNYLSFIFKYNIKITKKLFNFKFLFFLKKKVLFSLKFLISKIKHNNNLNLLNNLNSFLLFKKQSYIKIFEFKRLLFFYRW